MSFSRTKKKKVRYMCVYLSINQARVLKSASKILRKSVSALIREAALDRAENVLAVAATRRKAAA